MSIKGSGIFTGKEDIEQGKKLVEILKENGMLVTIAYGELNGEEAMRVWFNRLNL